MDSGAAQTRSWRSAPRGPRAAGNPRLVAGVAGDHVRALAGRTIPSARASRTIVAGSESERCCLSSCGVLPLQLVDDRRLSARPGLASRSTTACAGRRGRRRSPARSAARRARRGPSGPATVAHARPRGGAAGSVSGAGGEVQRLRGGLTASPAPFVRRRDRPSCCTTGAAATRIAGGRAKALSRGKPTGRGSAPRGPAPPRSAAAGCTWPRGRCARARRS